MLEYDSRVDSWAIGVLLYIMITGQVPFDGWDGRQESVELLYNNIVLTPLYKTVTNLLGIPSIIFSMLVRALEKEPKNRACPLELYYHPWIVQNTTDFEYKEFESINCFNNTVDKHNKSL